MNQHSRDPDRDVPGDPVRIDRTALLGRLLADPAPVVAVEAPAGTGKSVLLAEIARRLGVAVRRDPGDWRPAAGPLVWDVPALAVSAPLPDDLAAGQGGRIILAKRPGTAVPGLARAEVYGRVSRHGTADLMLGPADLARSLGPDRVAEVMARTGGWVCLLPAALSASGAAGERALARFLAEEVLRPLHTADLVAFEALLSDDPPRAEAALLSRLPFVDPDAPMPLHPALRATAGPMRAALRQALAARGATVPQRRVIANAEAAMGRLPEAIASHQSVGAWQAALRILDQARGPFFIHRYGPDAFARMLDRFPAEMTREEPVLVLCRSIQAVKRGEIGLARRVLTDRWGAEAAEAHRVLARPDRYPFDLRFYRMLMQTWEEDDLPLDGLDLAHGLLAELPPGDELRRGTFWNAVLEVYMRARRFAEADHAARRAGRHYERAGYPILSFFIHLHRGIIALHLGRPAEARTQAGLARAELDRTPFESPGDARLLALLDACLAYEQGQSDPLERFLSLDLDEMAEGEIWPSLVELVLLYGTQALAEHISLTSARALLDRWRATQGRGGGIGHQIDLREIALLQNAARWEEADALADALPSRIGARWVMAAAPADLAALSERDEVALVLRRLRRLAWDAPRQAGLEERLAAMLGNPHLTARQRVGAELWRAHVLRRQKRPAEALDALRRTLETAAAQGTVASLGEERRVLADLLSTRRMRDAVERLPQIRRVLRLVEAAGPGHVRQARAHGLTRQEARILAALAEGQPNKAIANATGVSEATVKFHLTNLYRKLGCSSRSEAVAAAAALDLVAQ